MANVDYWLGGSVGLDEEGRTYRRAFVAGCHSVDMARCAGSDLEEVVALQPWSGITTNIPLKPPGPLCQWCPRGFHLLAGRLQPLYRQSQHPRRKRNHRQ